VPSDDYGLEPGVMTVLVEDVQGRVLAGLIIGDSLPDGFGRYVRGTTDSDITGIPDYQVRPLLQAAGAALEHKPRAAVAPAMHMMGAARGGHAGRRRPGGGERAPGAAGRIAHPSP